MSRTVLAIDLGTSGAKLALYDAAGASAVECVVAYGTHFPAPGRHEQRPEDWWQAVQNGIRQITADPRADAARIGAIAISGHSLGCVPLASDGRLLCDSVPIWSDGRAARQARDFFARQPEDNWYLTTGNGFPPPLYTLFKTMWLRDELPEIFAQTRHILGTKDFINFRLTGTIATDPSYASGSGLYELTAGRYVAGYAQAAGVSLGLFPEIRPSSAPVGPVLPDIARTLGLPGDVQVMAGGVDNSCMALGGRCFDPGDAYLSLGSSSWISVASSQPILDARVRPYVFAHVLPDRFVSATSIFSSGTSVDWLRAMLTPGADPQAFMDLAARAPAGANGLIFVPTLGGGTSFEGGPDVRGGMVGLDLGHSPADLARAALEGVALGLRAALGALQDLCPVSDEILVTGGGAQSPLWRQIFADAFARRIVKSRIDRQASTLGAAALGLIGLGIWPDASRIRQLHQPEAEALPGPDAAMLERAFAAYQAAAADMRDLAPLLTPLRHRAP